MPIANSKEDSNIKLARLENKIVDLENLKNRYFRKIESLIWKKSENGEKICRHCNKVSPDHDNFCVALNITVLNNP